VPTRGYDAKRIHPIVGFDERTIKRNTKLDAMYNAQPNLRSRRASEKSAQIPRSDDPNHIFFLSVVPNHKLLYVCSSARQIIIKRHNLSFLFGTWMNLDRDLIYCWDGQDLCFMNHCWHHHDENEVPTGVCDCPAWLKELIVGLSFWSH
jgi:hypothetical protein